MKINQLKSIHAWVRESTLSEIVFVSALLLPVYLLIYNYAILQINEEWKTWALLIGAGLYLAGIVWMKLSQSKQERNYHDLLVIKNNIIDKGFTFMSFEKLLELDKRYTESRVRELILLFPDEIRLAKLKGNNRGVKVLNIEEEGKDK